MAKSAFSGNSNSQYDNTQIIKEVHDYFGQSLRTLDTRSLVSSYYSHFRAIYDLSDKPTEVIYYLGKKSHTTKFDIVSSPLLDGAYFTLRSAPDNAIWAIWYNIDGVSTQPVVPNAKYIEVNITSGDTAPLIALATTLTINNLYKDQFVVTRNGSNLSIISAGLGEVDLSNEGTTPFSFIQAIGDQEVVQKVVIDYDVDNNPIYEGQTLKGYSYDLYSGKFYKTISVDTVDVELDALSDSVSIGDEDGDKLEVNPDGSINVNVIQSDQTLKSYFSEVTNVITGVTTTLATYTALSDVYLQKAEVSGNNIAEFELVIDGDTVDRKRTYFNGNLENVFNFNNGLNITTGQVIIIYVVHTRPDPGSFSCRLQILE